MLHRFASPGLPRRARPISFDPMRFLQDLFANNRAWAARRREQDPEFFSRLVAQQFPEYLWIGCSDSRVPANEIVGLDPGDLFVHRNIANLVVHTDLNCLSVLQYAVDVLKVRHVIVTGHYGCGGVRAALENARLGLSDNWLRHVQDVREQHKGILHALTEPTARVNRLCELNVVEQVRHVCETTIAQDAWDRKQSLAVHGLVYGLDDGRLRDLGTSVASAEEVGQVYTEAVAGLAKDRPARRVARARAP